MDLLPVSMEKSFIYIIKDSWSIWVICLYFIKQVIVHEE